MKRILIIICALIVAENVPAQTTYTLKQCREMALKNNVKVRDARLEIESAKEQQREAKANYLPTVTAGATYFHGSDYLMKDKVEITSEQQQQIAGTIQALGLDPTALASLPSDFTIEMIKHGTMINLMALQPIYSGGRITTGNKLAALQTEVKQLMLEQTEDDVVKTVENYYNQLLSLYEKQNTLQAASRQLASIHKDARNAFNAGVANKNDVLTVELKQNEIAVDSLKLMNGVRIQKMVLAQYIGATDANFDIDRSLTSNLPAPATYLTDHESALSSRTEWQLLNKNVEAQNMQVKLKQGEMLPTVAVGAVGYYSDMTKIGRTKVIGLATVSVPISSWWSNKGVKRQKLAAKIAEQDRDDNKELLLIQMQNAYDNFEVAYQQVQIAKKSIEQSDENLRLNRDYYQAGMQGMSDLLDAQTKSQQARDQLTDAITQYLNCRTAYLLATGRDVQGANQ